MRASVRRAFRVLREGIAHFFGSHGLVYSAAVAFNLLLSAIPVLFLAFAAASLLVGRDELPFAILTSFLAETFPYGAQVIVPELRNLFASGATFGIIGTVSLFLASSLATDAVHTSLSVMLGVPQAKQFRRSMAFHVALVLTLIVLTWAAILVPPLWKGLSLVTKGLWWGWDAAFHALLSGLGEAALAGIVFLAGVLSYRYLSPRGVRLENALAGSLAFLLLLYAVKSGFAFYVKKFSRLSVIYGSLFSIVCFIIVAYLFAASYLFCASLIGVMEREEGGIAVPGRDDGVASDEASGGD